MSLETCRALEAQGKAEDAYRAFLAEGFVDDAARLLGQYGRGVEAADLLLGTVAKRPRPFDADDLRRAHTAATLYEQHLKSQKALEVLAWLGDAEKLAQLADRMVEQGIVADAAIAMARYGDAKRAAQLLTKVPRDDEHYALACVEGVRALARGATFTMALDRWFSTFIRRGPSSEMEAGAFYALAALYARQGMPENAEEVLGRLVEKLPDYKDAAAQKRRLETQVLGTQESLAKVLDEDAAFAAAAVRTAEPLTLTTPKGTAAVPVLGTDQATLPETATKVRPTAAPTATPGSSIPGTETVIVDEAEAPTLSFAPGVTVAKRYRINDIIGRGGMSIVYAATDLELNEILALKLFTQPTNEEAIERFKQEIKLARQLIHPNIIRVYDLGTALGARFLTMELLVGEDLHALMTRGISLRDGCNLMAQACDGLQVAHDLGVVHRDIKPENLFVSKERVVKVMDFGIAKQTRQAGLTMAGMVVGTPEYMAPEQAHGHMKVTPSADLYSIGIILYALATGQLPFRHDELVPLLMMHVSEAPQPPRTLNPGCPVEVEALILSLLQKRAEDRPPTAAAVAARLRELRTTGVV